MWFVSGFRFSAQSIWKEQLLCITFNISVSIRPQARSFILIVTLFNESSSVVYRQINLIVLELWVRIPSKLDNFFNFFFRNFLNHSLFMKILCLHPQVRRRSISFVLTVRRKWISKIVLRSPTLSKDIPKQLLRRGTFLDCFTQNLWPTLVSHASAQWYKMTLVCYYPQRNSQTKS